MGQVNPSVQSRGIFPHRTATVKRAERPGRRHGSFRRRKCPAVWPMNRDTNSLTRPCPSVGKIRRRSGVGRE
eukprot:16022507-Heterocapsa_arctica.AAC.1